MNPMLPLKSKIKDIWDETDDIKSFLIEDVIRKKPMPGQFYELSVSGMGEIPISIASWDDGLLFSIKNAGKITENMSKMKKGDEIGIRGPYGKGFPITDKFKVLIAGGIGLPPARSVIEHSLSVKDNNIQLLYGARSPKDLVYKSLLHEWGKKFDVEITVDMGDESWTGNVGVVTTIFNKIRDNKSFFYIIGPTMMMKFAVLELKKLNVPDANIFLSMERRMKCGIGICGHCNIGRFYVCRDGPVFNYSLIKDIPEIFF